MEKRDAKGDYDDGGAGADGRRRAGGGDDGAAGAAEMPDGRDQSGHRPRDVHRPARRAGRGASRGGQAALQAARARPMELVAQLHARVGRDVSSVALCDVPV